MIYELNVVQIVVPSWNYLVGDDFLLYYYNKI